MASSRGNRSSSEEPQPNDLVNPMSRSRSSLDGKPKKGGILSSLVGDTVGSLLASEAEGLAGSLSAGEDEDPEQIKALSDEKIISHFKDRLPNEAWVLSVTCAYKRRGIYCQGMLYLTTKRLLFMSPLCKNVLLHLSQVRGLRKQKTARVISNAILVVTKEKNLIFSSFLKRDKVWRLVYFAWQRECNPSVAPSLEEEDVELEQFADGSDDTDSGIAGELNSDDGEGDPFADDADDADDREDSSSQSSQSSQHQPSPSASLEFLPPLSSSPVHLPLIPSPSHSHSHSQQDAASSPNQHNFLGLPTRRKSPSPTSSLPLSAPAMGGSGSDNDDGLQMIKESSSGSGIASLFKKSKARRTKSEAKRSSLKIRAPKLGRGTLPPMPKPQAPSSLASSTASLDLVVLPPGATNKAMILTYVPATPSLLYTTFFTESPAASEHWQRILKNNPFGRVTAMTQWAETGHQQSQRRISFEQDNGDGSAPLISTQMQSVSLSTEELCYTVRHEGSSSFSTTLRCTYRTHNSSKVSIELNGSARLEPVSDWLSNCIGIMHKIFSPPVVRSKRPKKLRTVPVKAEASSPASTSAESPSSAASQPAQQLVKSITSEPLSLAICVILLVLILYSFYQILMLRWLVSSLTDLNRLAETAIEQAMLRPAVISIAE